MSSRSNQRNTAQLKGWVHFAIITIREDEFRAALQRFPTEDIIDGQRRYSLSSVMAKSGHKRTVVVVRVPDQDEARNIARDLINDLEPDWLILVGIAGATPSSRFTLGDVVVATRLQDFTIEARIEDEPLNDQTTGSPMHDLRENFGAWNSDDRIGMTRPIVTLSEENFYGDENWIAHVKESLTNHFPHGKPARDPVVTTGPTAASPINTDTLTEWQKVALHLIDIEMELPGIFREAKHGSRVYPILAIRGISDLVGLKSNDAWTAYACHSAASFAHALLSSDVLPLTERRVAGTPANTTVTSSSSKATDELRYASSITAADAKLVVIDNVSGEDIFLDADLYVPRDVEKQIIRHLNLAADRRKPIVTIGEAGRGKTSLLWHLYTEFSQLIDWQTWFIKSTMLVRSLKDKNSTSHVSSEMLVSAVQTSIAANRRPLLFIDTVDLLLHDESSRDFLVGLILKLDDLGCQTVLSTRPREVVRLNAFEFRRVTLLNYEGPELEDAIRKYVNRFYSESVRDDKEQRVSHILGAVARGLPLREVCENPLTLRMLFTIYRPAKVSMDINVFELYRQYWSHRVESDFRGGSTFSSDDLNAADCAEVVALTMLAEGSPEVSTQHVNQLLEELSVSRDHVEVLNTRSVLHSSGSGLTSFFHQTFFEHSAARGLLRKTSSESLSLLQKRLRTRKDDLFITPIYEQVLLLAADSSYTIRQQAESAIAELFDDDSLSAKMSALYVYCQRRSVAESTKVAAQKALRKAEEAIQIRFLELAPNIPNARFPVLFEELNLIWETGSDRTKDHLIDLLKRLVPRDWERVRAFFENRTLTAWAFAQKDSSNIAKKVLDVITAMSFHDPTWAWLRMIEFCGASLPHSNGRELSIALVNFLADNASLFEPKTIASRFERDTASFTLDQARDFHELGRSIGRLWAVEWTANKRSIPSILAEIDLAEQKVRAVTRTRGLPHILINASESDALKALKHVEEEPNQYNRSLWIDYVLPEWLEMTESANSESAPLPHLFDYLIKIFTDEEIDWSIKETFVQAVRYTKLSTRSVSALLPVTVFTDPGLWIETERLASVFGDAYFVRHPGPEAAIELLRENPASHANVVSKLILPSLMKRFLESECMMDTFFELATLFDDVAQMMRALEVIPNPSPPMFLKWTTPVRDDCLRVLNTSNDPQKRRYAILIWDELLKRGTQPVHKLDELLSFMKSEPDARVRGPLLSIIGRSTAVMSYDLAAVFEVLEPLARGPNIDLRRRAMLAISNVVAGFPGDILEYAFKALDNALTPPLDAQRLYSLRPIIERLVGSNADVAAEFTLKLIKGAHDGVLGSSGRHKVFGRLKTTVRLVVRSANHHRRIEFARLVPQVDRILGSLVTDALCHEALSELSTELDELLEADIAGDVKHIIFRYRYTQERSLGGGAWPEIYDLISQSSKSPQQTMKPPDSITIYGDNYGQIQQGGKNNTQNMNTRLPDERGKMPDKLHVLLLAANSVDTVDSQSADQVEAIDKAINEAPLRDEFEVKIKPALKVSGIGNSLLNYPADILHISGHSRKTEGLILEDDLGQVAKLQCDQLMNVVLSAGSKLRLVFLNFCHSADWAQQFSAHIDFALGFEGEVTVESSMAFGPAFYRALASSRSVQKAFEYGKGVLSAAGRADADAIVLHVRDGADATKSLLNSTARGSQQNLNLIVERVIRGDGSESDWAQLRHAIESGALLLGQRQVIDWDDPKENLIVSFDEHAGILQANLSPEMYRRVIERIRPRGFRPPPPPPVFIGREDDLNHVKRLLQVNQRLANRENITVVSGWPGVGKTSLVSKIGYDTEIGKAFKDGVLWISLEQNPNVISEMAKWGRALGTDEILKAPTPRDATALLARLLSSRRMLLIVDDVWDAADATAFTAAAGEQCSVMVTTRLPKVALALTTDDDHHFPLPVLTEEFALELLRILAPKAVEQNEQDCLELVRDLEYLPLALHVAAGLLRREANMDWGLKDLIEKIRNGTEVIENLAPKDRMEKDGVIPSVSSLLHRSTDVLDEFTRNCFICLGAFAAKPATFNLDAIKYVWQVDDPKPTVRALVDHGLLEPVGRGYFQMHRILKDHAKSLLLPKKSA
jgi:nucleoside phosphorylase/DNA replication protein DnaC